MFLLPHLPWSLLWAANITGQKGPVPLCRYYSGVDTSQYSVSFIKIYSVKVKHCGCNITSYLYILSILGQILMLEVFVVR